MLLKLFIFTKKALCRSFKKKMLILGKKIMIFKQELSPQNFHYDVLYPLYSDWDQKCCSNCLFSQKKTLCSSFKRKQDIFREIFLRIRRFGIRENMSRASYKCERLFSPACNFRAL